MIMRRCTGLALVFFFLLTTPGVHAQDMTDPDLLRLHGLYTQALTTKQEAYRQNTDRVLALYIQHLDRLKASAQAEGDLDGMLAIQAEQQEVMEQKRPGKDVFSEAIRTARANLAGRLQDYGTDFTNDCIRIEETYAQKLIERSEQGEAADQVKKALELSQTRLRVLRREPPPVVQDQKTPPPALGDNLVPHGDFDSAGDDTWHIHMGSRSRNGTELFTEPLGDTGGVRNRTLRLDRDKTSEVTVRKGIWIPPGTREISMTWRARLLKPQRDDVAVKGTGLYMVGLGTSEQRWNGMGQAQKAVAIYEASKTVPPPSGEAWETYSGILKVDEHLDYVFFRVPQGNGAWLVDDLELRPIKQNPNEQREAPPR